MTSKQEHIDKLSQSLFGKPASDIKYIMITDFIHESLLKENLNRTGLYNWIQTFKGKISKPGDVDDFNKFDIIHINMSKQDRYLPTYIRKRLKPGSKTVIVCNNDYTSELWEPVMEHPDAQCNFYKDADILFGTEYYQCTGLAEITGQKVYNIPHPSNIERLKSKENTQKKPYIAVIWRRYDKFAYVPFLAAKDNGLQTVLVGYDRHQDPNWYITESCYDHVVYHTDYDNYLKVLNEALIVYNPYTLHSYDRVTVDLAGMGCAVVGTDRTWSMKICYPDTMLDPYDIRQTKDMIKKMISNKPFYDKVRKQAQESVEYFNQENAKLRLLNSIYDSKVNGKFKGVIEYDKKFGEPQKEPESTGSPFETFVNNISTKPEQYTYEFNIMNTTGAETYYSNNTDSTNTEFTYVYGNAGTANPIVISTTEEEVDYNGCP